MDGWERREGAHSQLAVGPWYRGFQPAEGRRKMEGAPQEMTAPAPPPTPPISSAENFQANSGSSVSAQNAERACGTDQAAGSNVLFGAFSYP